MELDGSGNAVREYTYFPGVDQPHSVRMGGQTYYYAMEEPGQVSGLFNSSNQVVNQYEYTPFGITSVQETVTQPLRYMAREQDDASGLYYVRARWYDPSQGRFISEDPIGLVGGINPYAYAGNDPINNTDPSGLCYTVTVTTYEVEKNRAGRVIRVTPVDRYSYEVGCGRTGGGGGRGDQARNTRPDPSTTRPDNACTGFLKNPTVRDVVREARNRSLATGVENGAWLSFLPNGRVGVTWATPGTYRSITVPPPPAGGTVFVHGHPNSGRDRVTGRPWRQKLSAEDNAWAVQNPNAWVIASARDSISMDHSGWRTIAACSWDD